MKKGKYQAESQKNQKSVIILLTVAVVLLAAILVLTVNRPQKRQAKLPNGEEIQQSGPVEKKPDSIAIPGYEGINLKADTKEQEIGFPNPDQNTCYFQITLMLADGTTLWQSELVKPGEVSEPITLNEALAAGVYPNSLLKFDCYTMDGNMRSLNGAATKLTIHVS